MNTQLRTQTVGKEEAILERTEVKRRLSNGQSGLPAVRHKVAAPVMRDFDRVRRNIQTYSQGVFDTPHTRASAPLEEGSGLPEVPPRADFAHLSRAYLDHIHGWYPALHWPTFQREVDEVYTARSFHGMPREWIGLFFAVLACGSLQTSATPGSPPITSDKGMPFFDIATQALTPWPQAFTIVHAQVALLLSIFATESNMRPVGSMWLASAVRVAQELSINTEVDSWPVVDGEMRRRLWWAIYSRDRYVMKTRKDDVADTLQDYLTRSEQTHAHQRQRLRHLSALPCRRPLCPTPRLLPNPREYSTFHWLSGGYTGHPDVRAIVPDPEV